MKKLHLIILTLSLLLSQWGAIDHVYHDHTAGEVCDYCVTSKSLDHAVNGSIQVASISNQMQEPEILLQAPVQKSVTRYYAVRAPPRLIQIA